MSWSDSHGRVTRAFDEWSIIEQDIRAYLRLSTRLARTAYEQVADEISQEVGDDHFDLADVASYMEDLWPWDFEWMLFASVVKDAVTAFEIYLEKARDELLASRGIANEAGDRSPNWKELARFFRQSLTVELNGYQDLSYVLDLRHLLTHRRGELRTKRLRQRFKIDRSLFVHEVELTTESVISHMDTLARHVRRVDQPAYAATWGR